MPPGIQPRDNSKSSPGKEKMSRYPIVIERIWFLKNGQIVFKRSVFECISRSLLLRSVPSPSLDLMRKERDHSKGKGPQFEIGREGRAPLPLAGESEKGRGKSLWNGKSEFQEPPAWVSSPPRQRQRCGRGAGPTRVPSVQRIRCVLSFPRPRPFPANQNASHSLSLFHDIKKQNKTTD